MSSAVLDASALLAFLLDEPGADAVEDALAEGAAISAGNWAEVLSKVVDVHADADELAASLLSGGRLHGALDVEDFTAEDAQAVARLRTVSRGAGLSLGDRACLALGQRLGAVVLTADRVWGTVDAGVEVRLVR